MFVYRYQIPPRKRGSLAEAMPPKSTSSGHPTLDRFFSSSHSSKRPRDASDEVPRGGTGVSAVPQPTRPPSAASNSSSTPSTAFSVKHRVVCKHFTAGYCKDGERCLYAHSTAVHRSSSSTTDSATCPSSTVAPILCRYYSTEAGCRDGAACPMLHYNDFGHGVLHVPWSVKNVYTSSSSGRSCSHWALVVEQLTESEVNNCTELDELLVDLLPPLRHGIMKHQAYPTDFQTLDMVVDELMSAADRANFFSSVLPFMKSLVVQCPAMFPDGIPILTQGKSGVVRLSELQVLALLSCAFFCLFPGRHRTLSKEQFCGNKELQKHCSKLGFVNFGSLFGYPQSQAAHKLRCFIRYFETQFERRSVILSSSSKKMHIEVIRSVLTSADDIQADLGRSPIPLSGIKVKPEGVIEDASGLLQADFANHVLGGGVLNRGCVQEEIRFAVCPELLVSRMLCESLRKDEAVVINGASQFSRYTGYASTFQYAGRLDIPEPTPADIHCGVRNISVVAFDAINYNSTNLQPVMQYLSHWMQRDTLKAIVAFEGSTLASLPSTSSGAIATGNWGCGAFGGDVELKLLQQWIAASYVGRPLQYYTFGNEALASGFHKVETLLRTKKCTVRDLHTVLMMYHSTRRWIGGDEDAPLVRGSSSSAKLKEAEDKKFLDNDDDAFLVESLTEDFFGDDGSMSSNGPPQSSTVTQKRLQTVFEFVLDQFTDA